VLTYNSLQYFADKIFSRHWRSAIASESGYMHMYAHEMQIYAGKIHMLREKWLCRKENAKSAKTGKKF
jgi:hypothetical protein